MIHTQGCRKPARKVNKFGGASSEGWAESSFGIIVINIANTHQEKIEVKFEVYVLSISSGDFIECRSLKRRPQTFNEVSKFYLKLLTSIKKVWRFCHICVAFAEYMNFTKGININ